MSSAIPRTIPVRAPGPHPAWRERSARLFEELRGPCAGMVRKAYGQTLSDEEIEDAYSNAWVGTLRALEGRQARMDDEEIRRYVFTAVAHQAGKELRRRKRKPIAPLERATSLVDVAAAPDERADQREQSRITRDLLSSLPRRRRAVLLLRYGWGLEPTQVCDLIDGLSPRAYRKEITRGVDELTAKMKTLESGGWCEEREPILKVFAAGLADAEQKTQAEHHLAHCRSCAEFVGRLTGHLHDLGSAVVVPGALDLAADGGVDAPGQLADLVDRTRDSVGGVLARAGSSAADPGVATLPGAAPRGAAAAGAGIVAKLAGLGLAGKAALACAGGGALATVCVVAGVGPLAQERGPAAAKAVAEDRPGPRLQRVQGILPSQVGSLETPEPDPPTGPVDGPPGNTAEPPPEPEPEPVAPPVPGQVQDFGLAPSAPTPSSTSGSTSSSDSSSQAQAAEAEFGP